MLSGENNDDKPKFFHACGLMMLKTLYADIGVNDRIRLIIIILCLFKSLNALRDTKPGACNSHFHLHYIGLYFYFMVESAKEI